MAGRVFVVIRTADNADRVEVVAAFLGRHDAETSTSLLAEPGWLYSISEVEVFERPWPG